MGLKPVADPGQGARSVPLDNLKGATIFIVVLAHLFEAFPADAFIKPVWQLIYLFHMPVFVFISGFLSKRDTPAAKLISNLLIPYLILDILWYAWLGALHNGAVFPLLTPGWGLWYLLSLFFWRLALRHISPNRSWLAAAVVAGLAAGFAPFLGAELSLSRTITFFPFFLAGYLARKNNLLARQEKPLPAVAGLAVLSVFCLYAISLAGPEAIGKSFYLKYPYAKYPGNDTLGLALRAAQYLAAFGFIHFIAQLAPWWKSRNFFTMIGANTAPVYAFQFYFAYALVKWPLPLSGPNALIACLALAFVMAWLLSRPVAQRTYDLITAWPGWLYRLYNKP